MVEYLKSCLLLLRQCHMLHNADIFAEHLARTESLSNNTLTPGLVQRNQKITANKGIQKILHSCISIGHPTKPLSVLTSVFHGDCFAGRDRGCRHDNIIAMGVVVGWLAYRQETKVRSGHRAQLAFRSRRIGIL